MCTHQRLISSWTLAKTDQSLMSDLRYCGQGTKIFQYCTCLAGRVTYNFHSSCKHNVMHLSFKSVCNKEHKGVICYTTSSSYSSQSTHPTGQVLGKNYLSFLDFTRNYERTSGIFVAWWVFSYGFVMGWLKGFKLGETCNKKL